MASSHRNLFSFSDNVPSLRSYFHTGIHFDIETTWLSNLCNLYGCSHIGLCELFEIFPRTPGLEFQKVERDVLDDPGSEVPLYHATLIYFNEIDIYDQLLPPVPLLDSLVPAGVSFVFVLQTTWNISVRLRKLTRQG